MENEFNDTEQSFFNIQVIDSPDDEHNSLTIFCGDIAFSYKEHGNQLFNVVPKYIMEQRSGDQKYPIYITDIDISTELIG